MVPTRQRTIIFGLIIAGLATVGFFGLRALHALREFRRHGPPPSFSAALTQPVTETDVELIRDWMTIPYISQTYHVPPRTLFDAVGIPPRGNEEKSLKQLNEEYFPHIPGMVIELVKSALRAQQAAPTMPAPEPPLPPETPVPPQTSIPPISTP